MAEIQLTHIDSMTNVQLRAELKRHGCSTSGNKKDLIAKLRAALEKEKSQPSIDQHSIQCSQNEQQVIQTTLPIDNQITAQNPSVYNLTIPQDVDSSSAPVIPIPQQLSVSSSIEPEQCRSEIHNYSASPSISTKEISASNQKSSIDSSSNQSSTTTSIDEVTNNGHNILNIITNNNNLEMTSFASKSIEEEHTDIEKIGGQSYLKSIGSSSAKSESIVKETPLSDEQQRLNQSKSEQQQDNQSSTIDQEQISIIDVTHHGIKHRNKMIDTISTNLELVKTNDLDTRKDDESCSTDKSIEKLASQQQIKLYKSQTSSFTKGLHRSTNNKLNLTMEILKTLIADVSLVPESLINDELDELLNEQINDNTTSGQLLNEPVLETSIDSNLLLSDTMTIGELADLQPQTHRTVVMNAVADSSSFNNNLRSEKQQHSLSTHKSSFESKVKSDEKAHIIMTDEPVRIKNVTPSNETLSPILYIRGLTRPFSLFQLKELLNRYGTLIDDRFWLDKIKSRCFVTYETIEEAQRARDALDGCRWPTTNPKALAVRFGQLDELEFSKTHDLPPNQMSKDSINRVIKDKSNEISSRQSSSPIDETKLKDCFEIRESNKLNLQEEEQNQSSEIEEQESVETNEEPVNELSDYFYKTKAKPSIYWLPLTEDQIIERIRRRNAKRKEEHRQRELDENIQRSNSKSHQRSLSPREKRKRSTSLSRRDRKRY